MIKKPQSRLMSFIAKQPYYKLIDIEFRDVDDMCNHVRDWDLDFFPLFASGQDQFAGHIIQATNGMIDISYARFHVGIEQFGSPPSDRITFVVFGKSLRYLWWRGHETERGDILVFPIGSELHCLSGPDFDVFTVTVSENFCRWIAETHKLPTKVLTKPIEVYKMPMENSKQLGKRLKLLMDQKKSINSREATEIASILVSSWLEVGLKPSIAPPLKRERDKAVAKVLELMDKPDWHALTTGELCHLSGVSERTLQYAFRERFGLTPVAFLKARRLSAVRKLLKSSHNKSMNVGDMAAQFGFWHSGQFAADYFRAFGENPSETLLRG